MSENLHKKIVLNKKFWKSLKQISVLFSNTGLQKYSLLSFHGPDLVINCKMVPQMLGLGSECLHWVSRVEYDQIW